MFSSGKGLVSGVEDANGLESAIQGASGEFGSGYRLFFLRALAVPPPLFRPPMDMGSFIAEHPQNVHLTKVNTTLPVWSASTCLVCLAD